MQVWHNMTPGVITTLLKAGPEVNAVDTYGKTLLMYAAQYTKDPEVITTLLKAGADAKAKNDYDQTALDFAKYNDALKGTDAVKQLEEASQ